MLSPFFHQRFLKIGNGCTGPLEIPLIYKCITPKSNSIKKLFILEKMWKQYDCGKMLGLKGLDTVVLQEHAPCF